MFQICSASRTRINELGQLCLHMCIRSSGIQRGYECSNSTQRDPAKRCSRVFGLEFQEPPKDGDEKRTVVLCDGWRGLLTARIPSQQQINQGKAPSQPDEMRELQKEDGQFIIRIANGITERVEGHHYVTDSCVHSNAGNVSLGASCS